MPIPSSAEHPTLQELAESLNTINRRAFASEVASATAVNTTRPRRMRHVISTWRSLNAQGLSHEIYWLTQRFRHEAGAEANVIQLPAWVIARMQLESSEPLDTVYGMRVLISPNDGYGEGYVQLDYEPPLTARQPARLPDQAWDNEAARHSSFPNPGANLNNHTYPTNDADRHTASNILGLGPTNSARWRDPAPAPVPDTRASTSCSPANLYGYGRWSRAQRSMDR